MLRVGEVEMFSKIDENGQRNLKACQIEKKVNRTIKDGSKNLHVIIEWVKTKHKVEVGEDRLTFAIVYAEEN